MSARNYSRITPEQVIAALTDLDYAIIEMLPNAGAKSGFTLLKLDSVTITANLNDLQPPEAPRLKASSVAARLRGLKHAGLLIVVSDTLSGKSNGWQRTPRAVELLVAHKHPLVTGYGHIVTEGGNDVSNR